MMSMTFSQMISVLEICFVASFFINPLMIKPVEARCSQTEEFTIFDPNNSNAETCQRCPICPPGKGVSVQCGTRVKNGTFIGCQNCEHGTYSDHYDRSHCKPCNQCGHRITERPCTAKQNSICSTKYCSDGYYMDSTVDDCLPTHEIPTKTSAASTVSPINKSITLKSLLSKSVTPTPTGSTKSSETVKPVSRKETYSTSSTKADESTKPGSQPLNSTTSVSPDQRHNLRGIIGGGILCGAILIICFIAFIKDFSQHRTLFCIRRGRKGLNRDEEQPLNEFEPDGDHLDNGRTTSRYSNDKNSATTSSAETISSESTESTNDDTSFDAQQTHEETISSESTESTNDDTSFDAQQTHEETISSESTQSTNDDTNFDAQQIHEEIISSESVETTNNDANFDAQQIHEETISIESVETTNDVTKFDAQQIHEGSLVSETIVANVYMMDMLALRLDQSNPGSQHLAAEFNVPEKVKMKCQYRFENSPTKHMLEIKQSAEDTRFSVQDLIDGLRAISRNDLVKKVEDCLPGSASLQELRSQYPIIFENICLDLDHHNNWKDLGRNINIPDETLQQIATPTSCANTVLEILEKKNPRLTVKKMRNVFKGMQREDVCNVLHKYLQDSDTIVTLLKNIDCLEKVAILLAGEETPGKKNWLHFARELGVSKDECDSLKPKGNPSPTRALMKYIVQVDPDLTVKRFMEVLEKIQRIDVVSALRELIRDKQDTEDGPNISCPASRNES